MKKVCLEKKEIDPQQALFRLAYTRRGTDSSLSELITAGADIRHHYEEKVRLTIYIYIYIYMYIYFLFIVFFLSTLNSPH